MQLAVQVARLGNLNAISDAASGAALARAALTGAGLNVRINCLGLQDPSQVAPLLNRLSELEKQAQNYEKASISTLRERAGLIIGLRRLIDGFKK